MTETLISGNGNATKFAMKKFCPRLGNSAGESKEDKMRFCRGEEIHTKKYIWI